MSNKKVTKRALLTSILAICLCLVMLIGSTFAWFTDTASTSVNKIESGTLKVGLKMATEWNEDGTVKTWSDAKGQVLNFRKAAGHENEAILWEPGCTYELPALKVVNEGNLALKYKIQITGIKGDAMLNNVITWTIATTEGDYDLNTEHSLAAKVGDTADSDEFTIKGHMQETAGNDYQDKSITGIAITVLAMQDNVESDSYGPDYDKDANGTPDYPDWAITADVTVPVNTEGATVIENADGTVTVSVPQEAVAEDAKNLQLIVTPKAEKHADVTVEANQTFKAYDVQVIGVKENNEQPITVSFFVGKDLKNVKVYHKDTLLTAADDQFSYDTTSGYVSFVTKTFSPFTVVYNLDSWTDSASGSYSTPVDETSKTVTIASAEELALFAKEVNGGKNYKDYTVKLVNDINLAANMWTPIGKSGSTFQGIFDGQGHTISNLVCGNSGQSDVGLFGFTTNGEIKNFTLNNAKVKGYLDVGAVAGTPYTSKYTNIKLTGNVQVDGYAYVGGMFGKNAYANLTNLTIAVDAGSYVKADSEDYRTYIGGLVGFMGEGNQVVKNVTSNINVIGSTCDVGGITGIAHYGNTFINCTSSGNVTLTNAQDEGDHLEIGGIAGVWLNTAGQKVTFTDCSFTGKLSTALNGADKTSELVNYFGIVGAKYTKDSNNGTLIIDGKTIENH